MVDFEKYEQILKDAAAILTKGCPVILLADPADQLDRSVVLGLFTWDDAALQHHNGEIDIKLSRWGKAFGQNA
jgi:hypothetical protein